MSAIAQALLAELDDQALDQLARALAPRIEAITRRSAETAPAWMNTEQAAAYLACSKGRLYDLVQVGRLEPRRDGRRLLFGRPDLDAYLEEGR
jgi:excisionase family DNA binding protein